MREEQYKQLYLAASRCYTRGIQTGNGGNISARDIVENQMIVKASGGSLGDCDETGNGFLVTDYDGNPILDLEKKPTREFYLHGLIYRNFPSIGGIVHTHSPYSIAWSYQRKNLPAVTLHMQLKYGCDIPVVDIDTPVVMPKDQDKILETFEKYPNMPGFILVGHGIVAIGKNVVEAEHAAEIIEETAMVYQQKIITEAAIKYNGVK